jgi:alkaline phosphatase
MDKHPEPKEYQYYPDYIFFDDDLIKPYTQEEWKRVGLDSMPLYRIVKWDGKKIMPDKDIFQLKNV